MKKIIQLIFAFSITNFCIAQVGVNTINPHVSAELEIASTTKGLLIPRLTTAAIGTLSATASEGLVVFDTNKKVFLGWDGTKWQIFGNTTGTSYSFASWEVNGLTAYGVSPFSATTISQISSAVLERGSGLLTTPTAASNAWGGTDFNSSDLATSVTNGDFFKASLVVPSTAVFSFTKILAHNIRTSATGAINVQWQYSIDGTTFTNIGSPTTLTVFSGSGNNISEISLSSIYALQNISNLTVIFRLVGYGGTGGTGYINNISGNDLEIVGTIN